MKKIFCAFLSLCLSSVIFAQSQEASESQISEEVSEAWSEIGKQGKKLLQDAGKLIMEAGTEIGNTLKESWNSAKELKCYGTWVYKGKTTTTITINENGTMSISQKTGLRNDVWNGTYSATQFLGSISFKITEENHKTWVINRNSDTTSNNSTWYITYVLMEDGTMKFTSFDIPADAEDTDFSTGIIFTKAD